MQSGTHANPSSAPIAPALIALAAYDVAGFTMALDTAVAQLGELAAETASAGLFAASGLAQDLLGPRGWRWVAGLGDGAVFAHDDPQAAAASAPLLDQLARQIAQTTGLTVRTAATAGPVHLVPVARTLGRDGGWLVVGAGAANLHQALSCARVQGHTRIDPACVPLIPMSDLAAHAMQATTGVSIVMLVRLCARLDLDPASLAAVIAALDTVAAMAVASGARPVRTGADEKGIIVRLEIAPDTAARRHEAVSLANRLMEQLVRLGLTPVIALDAGLIYRAPVGAMRDGHGPPINAAAKALAALGPARQRVLVPDRFIDAETATAQPKLPSDKLLGRERDLARLLGSIDQGARLLLLEAPAGVGKSAVLTELGIQLAKRGHRIIRANVSPEGQLQPYRFLRQLLAAAATDPDLVPCDALAWAAAVLEETGHDPALAAWILADDGGGDAAARTAGRGRLEDALLALFRDLGSRGPVTALVDDMQFADRYSRRLAHQMGGRAGELVAIGTLRSGAVPELERDLDRVVRHRLEPLDDDSVKALISRTAPLGPADSARLVRLSQGNPLVAIQTALAASHPTADDGPARINSAAEAVHLRLVGLDGRQLLVLRLACLFPLGVDGPLLRSALMHMDAEAEGASHDAPERVAALLARQQLLEVLPDGFQPVHQLVRDYVVGQIPHAIRQVLAEVLAVCFERRLAALPAGSGRDSWLPLGRLWRQAGPAGAARAAACFARSARSALDVGAADLAVQLYDEARDCLRSDPGRHTEALIQLGAARVQALWAAGQAGPAALGARNVLRQLPLYRVTQASADTRAAVRGAAAVMAEAGQALGSPAILVRGNLEAVIRSLAPAGGGADPRALAFAAAMLDSLGLSGPGGWLWRRARAAVSSPRQGAFVAGHEAMLAAARADLPRLEAAIHRARVSLGGDPDRLAAGFLDAVEGLGLAFHGRSETAIQRLRRLGDVARDMDNRRFGLWAAYGLAQAEAASGAPEPALTRIRLAAADQADSDDHQLLAALAGLEARLLWQIGAHDEALQRATVVVKGTQRFATSLAGLEIFGGPALVLAAAVAQKPSADRTQDLARQAVARLRGAARLMPLARPRAWLVAALLAGQRARGAASARSHRALAIQWAARRQLAPETALIHAFT